MAGRLERVFLGWDGPALQSASQWLLDSGSKAGAADLERTVVVVPGGRARRMLIGALVEAAETRGVALAPPVVITPGEMPATLLGSAGHNAPPMVRRLAWQEALQTIGVDETALLPQPMERDDFSGWSRLAGALERASEELAGAGLRFADVPERAGSFLPGEEAERWTALGRVQERVVALLGSCGHVDNALGVLDQVTEGICHRNDSPEVVLLATPELNHVERLALQRNARSITSLIFAPPTIADRFDQFGCVATDAWGAVTVEIPDERIVFTDDPREQAETALATLAVKGTPVEAGNVVLGLADPDALRALRRQARSVGVTVRSALGESMAHSLPGQALRRLGASLRDPGLETLGALVRHPDVEQALRARSRAEGEPDAAWWLPKLDAAQRDHVLMTTESLPPSLRRRRRDALQFLTSALADLLGPDLWTPDATRPVHAWAMALERAMLAIYGGRRLHTDNDDERRSIEALEALRIALDELAEAALTGGGSLQTPPSQAIGLLEERLASQFTPEPARADAIETLGWLELALDPAPVCVIVGMSESSVPGSVTHDALLPDSLRARLGLRTNASRLARDAFLLSAIAGSRDATMIATRRGEDGDARTPSRLLFRCADTTLAHRVRRFTDRTHDHRERVRLTPRVSSGSVDQFAAALRVCADFAPPESMAVTDFGVFLRSPMAWYLERHLGLVEHKAPREMSAMHFGTLAHDALEAFGREASTKDLGDEDQIREALSDLLSDAARRAFGAQPPAPVRIQCELLRFRLSHFATWQARHRREGWRIAHVEWKPDDDAPITIEAPGGPMRLRGKIDRIDIHEDGDRARLYDYKTGKNAGQVETAHRRRDGQWRNLQLPLYHHLVTGLDLPAFIRMGYAGLPSSESEPEDQFHSIADWTAGDLESADDEARRIITAIRELLPGDRLDAGERPPDRGSLGFVTGERFAIAGLQGEDEAVASS